MGVVVILPSSGINYLWQLAELVKVSERHDIDAVYACSGGAWATMFLALGTQTAQDWLARAPKYMADWTRTNQYDYKRKTTVALREDAYRVFDQLGFFQLKSFPIRLYVRVCEVYPTPGVRIVKVSDRSPQDIFEWAIASSTIPGVTGSYARIGEKYFVDGGFKSEWKSDEIHPDDVDKPRIMIDTWSRMHDAGSMHIFPRKPLGSGLAIALPRVFSSKYFEDKIHTPGVVADR